MIQKNLNVLVRSWRNLKHLFASKELDALEGAHDLDEFDYTRLGWVIMVLGFGGFLLWAGFAPLDKGVPAEGTVITDGQRKIIQPAIGGVIEEILVRDGDVVGAGQLLVRLNELQVMGQAEGTLESIKGLTAQIQSLEHSVASQRSQIKSLDIQIRDMRDLVKEGYVARNRLMELERTRWDIESSLERNLGTLEANRHQLSELNKKLPGYQFDLENATIESPVDGSVVNLAVFTKGQVVRAGEKLMEISPKNQALIVEAKVPVHLIDKVYVGLPVEMIFSALNQRITPRIPGVVTVVSADRTTEEKTGEPYYKIQARVTEKGVKLLQDHLIRPGMPVQVYVVTGERTLLNYLFRPLVDRMKSSMGEE